MRFVATALNNLLQLDFEDDNGGRGGREIRTKNTTQSKTKKKTAQISKACGKSLSQPIASKHSHIK